MRRTLVLVRHAKSAWDEPSLADHDRPLAPRGEQALAREALRGSMEEHRTLAVGLKGVQSERTISEAIGQASSR